MSDFQEKCPNCGDEDIVTSPWHMDNGEVLPEVWIWYAGMVQIRISYCPYCGFHLPVGLLLRALNG